MVTYLASDIFMYCLSLVVVMKCLFMGEESHFLDLGWRLLIELPSVLVLKWQHFTVTEAED